MDREHWVPLSAAIVKLLNTLPGIEDSGDKAKFALAHKVGNAVEAAYRRGDMVEKRRTMMEAWARFLMRELLQGERRQT